MTHSKPKQSKSEEHTIRTSFGLNTGLTVIELVVGTLIGSVALMADGFKNLTDSLLLIVAMIADNLCGRNKRDAKIIRKRATELNIVIIFFVAVDIIYEALLRISKPSVTHGVVVIGIAVVAILINLGAASIIRSRKQTATRTAYFGLLSSAGSGLCVLISGALNYFYGIQWVDGIAGLLIGIILLSIDIKLVKNITAEAKI